MQELPPETVARAKLVVDSREAVWAEAGDLIIPRRDGTDLRRDRARGDWRDRQRRPKPGRENDEEITVFKSVGNAVQDVSVAARVYAEALKSNLGSEVEL